MDAAIVVRDSIAVSLINTVIKHNWICDILILDEIHRYSAETFSQVFQKVKYKLVMGLTATFERLDGKHSIIQKYCPIVDKISKEEAILNGWMAKYKEYQVLLSVDDIEYYKNLNKEFVKYFEFFSYDHRVLLRKPGNKWKQIHIVIIKVHKVNDQPVFIREHIHHFLSPHAPGFRASGLFFCPFSL